MSCMTIGGISASAGGSCMLAHPHCSCFGPVMLNIRTSVAHDATSKEACSGFQLATVSAACVWLNSFLHGGSFLLVCFSCGQQMLSEEACAS
jgi:hypothetical protein